MRGGFVKFIAYLQVIGIVLVVLGHSFHEFPDGAHGSRLLAFRLIYSFHMPLFLFVSGFLMLYSTFGRNGYPPSVGTFTLRKARRLLVPYLVLTLITYFPRAWMSGMADDALPLSFRGWMESLVLTDGLPIIYYWFIQASFLLLVGCYAFISFGKRRNLPMGVIFPALIAMILILGWADYLPVEVFGHRHALGLGLYFVAGAVYCEYYDRIDRWLPLDNWLSLGVCTAAWLGAFFLWEGTGLAWVSTVFGIGMAICGAKLLVRYECGVLDHLVGANYLIFLLSWYFNVLTQQVLGHYVELPWWVHTVLSLVFGIYVPWVGYRLLRRYEGRRWVRVVSRVLGQ